MRQTSGVQSEVSAALGMSLVETIVVLGVAALLAGFAVPLTVSARDEARARQAAAFAAGRLRDARQQAVMRGRAAGLVFDREEDRWLFRLCLDGNANGLRRADLTAGTDRCLEDNVDLATLFPGVSVSVDPAIRGPDGDPPSDDAVRFGSSDMASFSPAGGCTPGSLFVRSAKGAQFAVRIAGVTGRLRVLRYDAWARTWRPL